MQNVSSLYRGGRGAFDRAAADYDNEFERHPATRRIRRIVRGIYHQYFQSGDSLLELNCGTGTDAVELASKGMRILATDSSPEMIAEVRKKLHGTALHSRVEPMLLPFSRLHQLRDRSFDGAFSNFGGLNCTNRLLQVADDLGLLVKPGRYVIITLMPKFSVWETLSFVLRGKWRKAFRRRQPDGVLADMHGEKVWVRYYDPSDVVKAFSSMFVPVAIKGLNVFAPPPASRRAYKVLGRFNRVLEHIDDTLPGNSRLHALGDHYVIVLQRKARG